MKRDVRAPDNIYGLIIDENRRHRNDELVAQ